MHVCGTRQTTFDYAPCVDCLQVVGCTTIIGCSSNYNSTYGGNTPKYGFFLTSSYLILSVKFALNGWQHSSCPVRWSWAVLSALKTSGDKYLLSEIESSYLTCLWTLGSKKIFLTKCLNLCRLCRWGKCRRTCWKKLVIIDQGLKETDSWVVWWIPLCYGLCTASRQDRIAL